MTKRREASPTIMVIFGASGDLTQRKLVPSLFALFQEGHLPEPFTLIGTARTAYTDEEFRAAMREAVDEHSKKKPSNEQSERFAANLRYLTDDFSDAEGYGGLKQFIEAIEEEHGVPRGGSNRLFYLAVPPSVYGKIVAQLGKAKLAGAAARENGEQGWTRLIIEKPFGHDLESARALNREILRVFDEEQVYRIDHYLGKENVQNILTFRFGNAIFEPLWNRNYVDHVQITVAEKIGIEGRGGYYDKAGALRDIVQNHILQVLALTAMEPPSVFNAEAFRNEKLKVLHAINPITRDEVAADTVRGQYEGYYEEEGVAPDSNTETYVAMRFTIDNWRWAGVPFYVRTGKSLTRRVTEVTIQFRQPPLMLFAHSDHDDHHGPDDIMEPNLLTLRVQPDEGMTLRVGAKPPGNDFVLRPVPMSFDYSETFHADPPEAYTRLLLDAIIGDATLFIRRDEVEAAWALMEPIMDAWAETNAPPERYPAGSWGPKSATALIEGDGRHWFVSIGKRE